MGGTTPNRRQFAASSEYDSLHVFLEFYQMISGTFTATSSALTHDLSTAGEQKLESFSSIFQRVCSFIP